jgi:hypothetical protein
VAAFSHDQYFTAVAPYVAETVYTNCKCNLPNKGLINIHSRRRYYGLICDLLSLMFCSAKKDEPRKLKIDFEFEPSARRPSLTTGEKRQKPIEKKRGSFTFLSISIDFSSFF